MSEPITIEEVAEFFEQNFASAMAWDFMPERKREVAVFLRHQAETIKAQGEEIDKLNRLHLDAINMIQNEHERGYVRAMADSKYREDAALELVAKTEQERDEEIKEAYLSGYGKAHNDTVEGLYSPDQSSEDYMEEVRALKSDHTEGK